jgi:hypothetical protein
LTARPKREPWVSLASLFDYADRINTLLFLKPYSLKRESLKRSSQTIAEEWKEKNKKQLEFRVNPV